MKLLEKTDDEILKTLNPIMDNLMDASTKIDYERFIIDFSQRMKNLTTEKVLTIFAMTINQKKAFLQIENLYLYSKEKIQ